MYLNIHVDNQQRVWVETGNKNIENQAKKKVLLPELFPKVYFIKRMVILQFSL